MPESKSLKREHDGVWLWDRETVKQVGDAAAAEPETHSGDKKRRRGTCRRLPFGIGRDLSPHEAHVHADRARAPQRSNSCSCKARSSFGWSSSGMSPTSSRKRVPRFANSKRPTRCVIA